MTPSYQNTKLKDTFTLEEEPVLEQGALTLEEKYDKLQQAYRNVCLERDLLRRSIKVYAAHLVTGIDTS